MSNYSSKTKFDYDLICIGNGPAGQTAAVQAAKLGEKAAVIEKRGMVGGHSSYCPAPG